MSPTSTVFSIEASQFSVTTIGLYLKHHLCLLNLFEKSKYFSFLKKKEEEEKK